MRTRGRAAKATIIVRFASTAWAALHQFKGWDLSETDTLTRLGESCHLPLGGRVTVCLGKRRLGDVDRTT